MSTQPSARMVFAVQFVIMVALVSLVGIVGVSRAVNDAEKSAERSIAHLAETIRRLPAVTQAMKRRDPHADIQPIVDAALTGSGFQYITIADLRGFRVAHVDPKRVGEKVSSDHGPIRKGSSFHGIESGPQGVTYRVKLPIVDTDGRVLGTISVGELVSEIRHDALNQSLPIARASLGALVLGTGLAWIVSRWLHGRFRRERERLERGQAEAELLRVEAHEFENRMHLVAGLIELGHYDEARTYLSSLPRVKSVEGVREPMIAALVSAQIGAAAREHVTLELSEGSKVGADWRVDDDDLMVIANLVTNAVEATGFGGNVWLSLIASDGGHHLSIRVEDDGPGFAEDEWELTHRGVTSKDDPVRHGIGLSSVARVVKQRGGRLSFSGSVWGGARVDVSLPCSQRTGTHSEAAGQGKEKE